MTELKVNLDPCNPGQFYACCGLFEFAAAYSPRAMAHFVCDANLPRKAGFVIAGPDLPELSTLLKSVRDLVCEPLKQTEPSVDPVCLTIAGRAFNLDWWLDEFRLDTTNLKCWAGQVTTRKLFEELPALIDPVAAAADPMLFRGMTKSKFGADPRSAWNALDFGYSPNVHNQDAATLPRRGSALRHRPAGLPPRGRRPVPNRLFSVDRSAAARCRPNRGAGALGRSPSLRLHLQHREARPKL